MDSVGKKRVEKLTVQFLNTHAYFSKVWSSLTQKQREVVLEIIVNGKGVVPYESSVKWTVLAHFGSQPRGQDFQAQT